MSDAWIVVALVGLITIVLKATGPVFLGKRALPARLRSMVDLLAPVMLMGLVVTQTFGGDQDLEVDARIPGVAVAAVAIWLRAPVIVAMVIAGAVTALIRAVA